MPHLLIEYSSNMSPTLDVQQMVDRVHAAALETGVFQIGAIRTRAVAREHYRIADGHPDNGFVHVVLRIGHGREPEVKRRLGETMFGAICDALASTVETSPVGISFEIQETDPALSFKRNDLHEIVRRRTEAAGEGGS